MDTLAGVRVTSEQEPAMEKILHPANISFFFFPSPHFYFCQLVPNISSDFESGDIDLRRAFSVTSDTEITTMTLSDGSAQNTRTDKSMNETMTKKSTRDSRWITYPRANCVSAH